MSFHLEDFSGLEADWRRLLREVPGATIFSEPQWQRLWWQEFGEGEELKLLAWRPDGELRGVAPLMRQGGRLSLVGSPDLCDYMDLVVAPGEEVAFISALLDYLADEEWGELSLSHLPAVSPTLQHLPPLARERGYRVETEAVDVCPRLELPPTWDDYLGGLTKKDRHELRRKLRRLEADGPVTSYVLDDADDLETGLADFLRLHVESREDKRAFMTPQMTRFFTTVVRWLHQEGYLRLYFLEINGERVSAVLCFDYQGQYLLYNSGYDLAYRSLSVGLLLKAFCLRDAIALGRRSFDFLRGREPYKYDLGGRDLPIYQCTIRRG